MDPRERWNDHQEQARVVQDAMQRRLHTAFPGFIYSWDSAVNTCVVIPAIKYVALQGQKWVPVQLPKLLDCPVHFPAGGGVTLTFPLKPGDECLVVIAERCINAWWSLGQAKNGEGQVQEEYRMHDLSDGFVIPKVWSVPKVIPSISTDSAQLRTSDGSAFVEVKEDGNINLITTQNVTITAGKAVTVNAGEDVTVNAGQNATVNADQDVNINAQRDVQITAGRDFGVSIGRNWNVDGADAVNISSDTAVNITAGTTANIKAPRINEGS